MENLKVKRFYNYSEIDGSYIDYEDIQQDVWVLQIEKREYYANPAYSTEIKPLEPKEGFKVCFNEKGNNWEYREILKEEKKEDESEKLTLEQRKILNQIFESQKFLYSTDWYVTRKIETGKEIPEDILNKRKEARDEISKLIEENEDLKQYL
jgi:hypothetical protein